VKTVDGVVYQQGVVDSERDRAIAEDRTRKVPNVINAVNQLQVSGSGAASTR
jgi:osmotically-inducible protein OsmY